MNASFRLALLLTTTTALTAYTQENVIRYDFSKPTAAENGVTVMEAGFGSLPSADVTFGSIPTENAFTGATDGAGVRIQADPGEGMMLLTDPLTTDRCALIRCSVRSAASHASVYLATIDQGQDSFVSTITPNNGGFFAGRYNRIADVFLPPSSGFRALVQIVNTSQTEPLTVYVDNLEILLAGTDRLDFAVKDLAAGELDPTVTPTPNPIDTPTPELTFTPTPEPTDPQTEEPTFTPTPDAASTPKPLPFSQITVPLPNLPEGAKPLEMILIPAGTFMMGSPASEQGRNNVDEWEPHPVTITKDFYLGKFEVTQTQLMTLSRTNYSNVFTQPNGPAYNISFFDTIDFCNRLSDRLGLTPAYYGEHPHKIRPDANGFRLPTEAEWEYACRAGTTTRFSFGDVLDCTDEGNACCETTDKYMWWSGNSGGTSHEVGLKMPNPWELFDMHGNVAEWCNDYWEPAHPRGAQMDPQGPQYDLMSVIRGGGFIYPSRDCRSTARSRYWANEIGNDVGFRVAITYTDIPTILPTVTPITPTWTPTNTATATNTPTAPLTPTSTAIPTDIPTPSSYNQGDTITVLLNLPDGAKPLEMILNKAGTFMMGSPETERGRSSDEEWLPHPVTITQDFYLGKYEVTQAQWQAVMGTNPSLFKGPNRPVEQVRSDDCLAFINKLNQMNQGTFRLPTEAEWEYACRAGTTTRFSHGDILECGDEYEGCLEHEKYMWWEWNSDRQPHEVGLKLPNPWGFFDMHGNVCEWCSDWWQESFVRDAQIDPHGPESGYDRVIRGGSWLYQSRACRSAFRGYCPPDIKWDYTSGYQTYLGFRIAKTQYDPLNPPTATPTATITPTPTATPTEEPTPTPVVPDLTITVPLDLPAEAKPWEMILIKAGTFSMGSPLSERGRGDWEWVYEWESHRVTLTQDYFLGKYEVTQAQWQAVMGNIPVPNYRRGLNFPIDSVSWDDCQIFIQKLNQMDQGTFRLPTEAEWEYACRAGTTTRFSFGDALECEDCNAGCPKYDRFMWWCGTGNYEVGAKFPNPWGLYDMHGSVWEWCSDWWQNPDHREDQIDPPGPDSGKNRVKRGGGRSGCCARECRSASRSFIPPHGMDSSTGLRLVRIP